MATWIYFAAATAFAAVTLAIPPSAPWRWFLLAWVPPIAIFAAGLAFGT